MKKTVIATVGTSLLGGIQRNGIDWNLPVEDIVKGIQHLENVSTICAEISSIQSIIREGILDEKENLYLLASDTVEGEKINHILKGYFASMFQHVKIFTVENLNGQNAKQFTEEGLRNLVKIIVQIVKTVPNQEAECVMNATGGYKAQISFAGLIGQVLKIPVYYQFEGFSSVVQLPEMPVAFDYQIWIKHFTIFKELYELGIVSSKLLPSNIDFQGLKGLVEESNGQLRLSSAGLLLHEVLWNRYKDEKELFLPRQVEEKQISSMVLKDIPISLQTLMDSIQQLSFVYKIEFTGKKEHVVSPLEFQAENVEKGLVKASFGYHNATWNFIIYTSAVNEAEVNAVIIELYQRYQPIIKHEESSVEFILVRHGQHVGEKEKRIEGWANFELTEFGHEQSRLVARYLKEEYPTIDVLYASSLMRAKETAEHIGREIGLEPIILDDLRAMNYGKPGGLTKGEAEILYPLATKQVIFDRTYDGESNIEFNRRIVELFYELVHKYQGKTVCLVTHGRAINVILKEIMNLPLSHDFRVDSDDTSVHHFVMKNNQTFIRRVNDVTHLARC